MLTIFTLIAGFGLGTAACLAFMLYREMQKCVALDRERMLWTNKALIRQGQVPIFTPDMLGEDRPSGERTQAPVQVKSPFQSGIESLRNKIESEKRGPKLPPEVTARIEKAAEERANQFAP